MRVEGGGAERGGKSVEKALVLLPTLKEGEGRLRSRTNEAR